MPDFVAITVQHNARSRCRQQLNVNPQSKLRGLQALLGNTGERQSKWHFAFSPKHTNKQHSANVCQHTCEAFKSKLLFNTLRHAFSVLVVILDSSSTGAKTCDAVSSCYKEVSSILFHQSEIYSDRYTMQNTHTQFGVRQGPSSPN